MWVFCILNADSFFISIVEGQLLVFSREIRIIFEDELRRRENVHFSATVLNAAKDGLSNDIPLHWGGSMTKAACQHDENHLRIDHRSEQLGRPSTPAEVIETTLNIFFKDYKIQPLQTHFRRYTSQRVSTPQILGCRTAPYHRRIACSLAVTPLSGTRPSDTLRWQVGNGMSASRNKISFRLRHILYAWKRYTGNKRCCKGRSGPVWRKGINSRSVSSSPPVVAIISRSDSRGSYGTHCRRRSEFMPERRWHAAWCSSTRTVLSGNDHGHLSDRASGANASPKWSVRRER